jgi:hypothetical protein
LYIFYKKEHDILNMILGDKKGRGDDESDKCSESSSNTSGKGRRNKGRRKRKIDEREDGESDQSYREIRVSQSRRKVQRTRSIKIKDTTIKRSKDKKRHRARE